MICTSRFVVRIRSNRLDDGSVVFIFTMDIDDGACMVIESKVFRYGNFHDFSCIQLILNSFYSFGILAIIHADEELFGLVQLGILSLAV